MSLEKYRHVGFLIREHGLVAYTTEETVDGDIVIACIDAFINNLTGRTMDRVMGIQGMVLSCEIHPYDHLWLWN